MIVKRAVIIIDSMTVGSTVSMFVSNDVAVSPARVME